jgi:hypothetical protein
MCLKTQRITAKDVIEDIRLKLSERNVDEDDDVASVSAKLTIALRDPLTASIFTTPVRGVQCRHREYFKMYAALGHIATLGHIDAGLLNRLLET